MAVEQVRLFGTTIWGPTPHAWEPAGHAQHPIGGQSGQQHVWVPPQPSRSGQVAEALLHSACLKNASVGATTLPRPSGSGHSSDTSQQTSCTASGPSAVVHQQLPMHQPLIASAMATASSQAQRGSLRTDSISALRDAAEALQVLQSQRPVEEPAPAHAAAVPAPAVLAARAGETPAERQERRRTSVQIAAQLPPNLKLCSSCREVKPHLMYHQCKAKRDGLQDRCKACRAELDRQRLLLARSSAAGAAAAPAAARADGASRSASASSAGKRSRAGSLKAGDDAFLPQSSAPPSFTEPMPLDLAAKRRRFPQWGGIEERTARAVPAAEPAAASPPPGWAVPKAPRTARRASAPVAAVARWATAHHGGAAATVAPSRFAPSSPPRAPLTPAVRLTRDEVLKGRRIMFASVAIATRVATIPALRCFLAAMGQPAARASLVQRAQIAAQTQQPRLVRPLVRRHSYSPAWPPVFAGGYKGVSGMSAPAPYAAAIGAIHHQSAFAACL